MREAHLKKERAKSFDTIAQDYEQFRPGYPDDLRVCLEKEAALKPGSDLLEIGVGPGQATRLFLGKDYRIVGIEPGHNLRQVAWKTLGEPKELSLEGNTFEAWEPENRSFDLIYSGSAFHWVDPVIGFPKVAKLIRPQGRLALFWNMFPDPEGEIWEELAAAYCRNVPEMGEERGQRHYRERIEERREQISQTGLFKQIAIHHFPWEITYTTSDYLNLLMTYSDHITLASNRREKLFQELRAIIDSHGGKIIRPFDTVLYLMSL